MDNLLIPGGLVVTCITLIIGWVLSGQIRKTDADRLWIEAQKIRDELKENNEALDKRIVALEEQNETLRRQIAKLEWDNKRLTDENASQLARLEYADHRLTALTNENQRLTARVVELEGPNTKLI